MRNWNESWKCFFFYLNNSHLSSCFFLNPRKSHQSFKPLVVLQWVAGWLGVWHPYAELSHCCCWFLPCLFLRSLLCLASWLGQGSWERFPHPLQCLSCQRWHWPLAHFYWPFRAFWSASHTKSPTATFHASVWCPCLASETDVFALFIRSPWHHSDLVSKPGQVSWWLGKNILPGVWLRPH